MKNPISLVWTVGQAGYRFTVSGAEASLSELTAAGSLSNVSDTATTRILMQLLDEDSAELLGQDILVPHATVADLPVEDLRGLSLSEPFPFEIEIRASGNLADRNLSYIYQFLNGKTQPFVNPTRIGTHIEITNEQTYLITGDSYRLVEAIDEFNRRPPETRATKQNLLAFAKIKELAQETGAVLDTYLNTEQIVAPTKLSIRLKRNEDGTLEVEPVLCEIEKSEDGQEIVHPILDEETSDTFVDVFDRLPTERDIYPIPNGPRVVLNDDQKKALHQFKKLRRVSGSQKKLLLEQPQAFFDPDIVHLDNFSDRVQEIGEYRPRIFPFLRPQKESWLPPEGGILIDGTMIYVPQDEIRDIKERVEVAISLGKQEVEWKGQHIPATPETVQALEALSELNVTSQVSSTLSGSEEKRKKILIIIDNFEETVYRTEDRKRPGNEGVLPEALLGGVSLLPHQSDGLFWLQRLWITGANGALLADDMGLGKTLQALAFLAWCRELMDGGEFPVKPMLIIAPVALLENWKEEYDRFLKPIFGPFVELHGTGLRQYKQQDVANVLGVHHEVEIRDQEDAEELIRSGRGLLLMHTEIARAGAVLTTYETLRDYQFSLGLIEWGVMVVDEAQKVKTPSAMVTMAVKAMKYEFGLGMTGTPVENSWVDLWSLVDFVQPGRLGSLKAFVATYQTPLKNPDTNREELGQRLKSQVDSLLKRRMKEDHLEGLPTKRINEYRMKMPKVQLDRYLSVVEQARRSLPDPLKPGRKQHIFSTIAALRDISLCPHLPFYDDHGFYELSDEELIQSSARIQKAIELLEEIRNHSEKVIIFLISRKMQRVMQRIIQNRFGIHTYIVNGEVIGGRRKTLIDAFQNTDGFNVIIMSPEAAGVGLNVTSANHVIHLSRAWNPAKEDQATDRVYRIGQKRDVVVHLPLAVHPLFENEVCNGTFDLKLHRLLDDKRILSRSVLLPASVGESEMEAMGAELLGFVPDEKDSGMMDETFLDRLTPEMFENAVATLYRKQGFQAECTPQSKDYGADVVALPHSIDGEAFLIQCKHTTQPDKSQGPKGIQEVLAARGVYSAEYRREFKLVVITNAKSFTSQAYQVASANQIMVIDREKLCTMLNQCQVMVSEISFF